MTNDCSSNWNCSCYSKIEGVLLKTIIDNLVTIKTSISDNSKGIFCLGWKSATSLATQNKRD